MTQQDMPRPRHSRPARLERLHPWPVRVMHWLNAVAIIVMIGSGWKIYGDEPIFLPINFPAELTFGGHPEIASKLHGNGGNSGALLWHFAMMWVLVVNGLFYLTYGIATGRLRRKFLPIRPREVIREIGKALRFDLPHEDVTVYNSVQRLLYVGVIVIVIVQVATGLAIWKPVQFQELTALFGGFQPARLWHFFGMAAVVGFLLVHVALALIVPKTIWAMLTGGPRVEIVRAEPGVGGSNAIPAE